MWLHGAEEEASCVAGGKEQVGVDDATFAVAAVVNPAVQPAHSEAFVVDCRSSYTW